MYFLALAADFDGTLAENGVVSRRTCEALDRLKATGRRLILVTGRELPQLQAVFPELSMFDRVVAENGGVLYDPGTGRETLLGQPPYRELLRTLAARSISPVSVGRCVVAAWEPHHAAILDVIRELGLELQLVFNKGAIMILPSGINKATGLDAALHDLELSSRNVIGVGDAENDHAFLRECGCAAVVANALPSVKAEADILLRGDHGAGVAELAEIIMANEESLLAVPRQGIRLGSDRSGKAIYIMPNGGSVLIVGTSGSGKSKLSSALIEQMVSRGYEFCVIDPEGDYSCMDGAVRVGDVTTPPAVTEALRILHDGDLNLIVNTQALTMGQRSILLRHLLRQTAELRARTGRPHWILVDEAHQVLSESDPEGSCTIGGDMPAAIIVTFSLKSLCKGALASVDAIIVLGDDKDAALRTFADLLGIDAPLAVSETRPKEAVYWAPRRGVDPTAIRVVDPDRDHRRHAGKYAVGDVGAERSFYFRGPEKRYNDPARNLYRFMEIGERVDDQTWHHHLANGDYARWFRHVIRDERLAREAEELQRSDIDAAASRRRIRKAICRSYATPESA